MATNYDNWKASAPEEAAWHEVNDCPVCSGGEGHPCSEECEDAMLRESRGRRISGLLEQAKRAVRLAKAYRAEDGPGGRRERECLVVVDDCRIKVRMTRALVALDERRRSA